MQRLVVILTAVVVLAALRNALLVCNKRMSQVRAVVNGVGAAGTAIIRAPHPAFHRAGCSRFSASNCR